MAVRVTIWHNPRCSKSRETLALLQARGIRPEVRLYQTEGPSEAELRDVLRMLNRPVGALARVGDAGFAEAGLTADMDEARLIAGLAARPDLIERPVVIANGRAALGRPPEAVLEIL